jgi:hypothetical protein
VIVAMRVRMLYVEPEANVKPETNAARRGG